MNSDRSTIGSSAMESKFGGVPLSVQSSGGTNSPVKPEKDDSVGYSRLLQNLLPVDDGHSRLRVSSGLPAATSMGNIAPGISLNPGEMEKVKQELAVYKERLAQREEELNQHRLAKQTLEHVDNVDTDTTSSSLSSVNQNTGSAGLPRPSPSTPFGLSQNIWSNGIISNSQNGQNSPGLDRWQTAQTLFNGSTIDTTGVSMPSSTAGYHELGTPLSAGFNQTMFHHLGNGELRRTSSLATVMSNVRAPSFVPSGLGLNTNMMNGTRPANGLPSPVSATLPDGSQGLVYMGQNFAPTAGRLGLPMPKVSGPNRSSTAPMPTRLSPTAAEFSVPQASSMGIMSSTAPTPTAVSFPPTYADNWKHLVEKIVHSNDQQASILMQQKIKSVDRAEKTRMCDAIVQSCDDLMTNRFGNFLVQRVLEHGTPEQIQFVSHSIAGRVVPLSMDAFGCHVIQKALDTVPESFKIDMVRELLMAIPDTVKHRYACHVWQKLFELRWSGEPPQIMDFVNRSLDGQWWDVAMGETGSLVVQNIFENCNDQDKRPCVEEVLSKIDVIARGQYGNWCIQHICEHGAPLDRERAITHILDNASEYSMDQFASKVVEKCLKIGGGDFLERYLSRVCSPQGGRPRVPLVDIACNQYGNYLIQWVLQYAESDEHKDAVRVHARKHIVSLRGSKYGSRVASLVTNMATHTRPGPPTGLPNPNRYGHYPHRAAHASNGQYR